MTDFPSVRTERLVLGAFDDAEAPELQRLAGAREIADTTLMIPHPYELAHAEQFIALQRDGMAEGQELIFAIHRLADARLVGTVALREIDPIHLQAELGYWIGVPFWNQGYATEAARAVVDLGFARLGLNRIYAHHMARNPASGRVLERIGMQREGVLRQRVRKWGQFEDVVIYSVVRDDLAALAWQGRLRLVSVRHTHHSLPPIRPPIGYGRRDPQAPRQGLLSEHRRTEPGPDLRS